MKPAYWFPVKRYGWGWGMPVCWQGWLVMAVFLLSLAALGWWLDPARDPLGFSLGLAGLSIVFTTVVAWKGERPVRWRWGDEDKPSKR